MPIRKLTGHRPPAAADDDFSAAPVFLNPDLAAVMERVNAARLRKLADDPEFAAKCHATTQPKPDHQPPPQKAVKGHPGAATSMSGKPSHVQADRFVRWEVAQAFHLPDNRASIATLDAARDWAVSVGLPTKIHDDALCRDYEAHKVTWSELLATWDELQSKPGFQRPNSVGYILRAVMNRKKAKPFMKKAPPPAGYIEELNRLARDHGYDPVTEELAAAISAKYTTFQEVEAAIKKCSTMADLVRRGPPTQHVRKQEGAQMLGSVGDVLAGLGMVG